MFGLFIDGIVVRGLEGAAITLKKQIPLIAEEFPEIRDCHRGSINIKLERALQVANPDYRTRPIAWGDPNPEVFGFLRVSIQVPCDGPMSRAWIYIPYSSPHFANPNQVEIISPKIPGVVYGSNCRLLIPFARTNSTELVIV